MGSSDYVTFLDPNECSIYRQLSRKFATRRLGEMIRWIIIMVILLYVLKMWLDYSPGYVIDKSFANVVPGPSSSNLLAKVCSEDTKICYGVMDYAEDERGLIVRRVIYVKGFEKEVDTMVTLIPPNGLSFHNSDSKLWRVNHTDLNTQYVAVLCLFPFVLGSVPSLESSNEKASIMNIGLGGGSVDMFLHTLKPKWKIDVYELDPTVKKLAHDWFGVVDNEYRKTYVKDGLVAVQEAIQKNLTYNAVILDGCDTDKTMPCPAKDFLKPQNLKNIKAILKPTGCMVMNLLILDEEHKEERIAMVEHQLLSAFPTCLISRMDKEENAVVACLPYALEPDTMQKTREMWHLHLNDFMHKFPFNFNA